MNAKDALVAALKEEMKRQGVIRKDLARRLGCTEENVAQLLDERRHGMRISTAERLAEALGCQLTIQLEPKEETELGPRGPEELRLL